MNFFGLVHEIRKQPVNIYVVLQEVTQKPKIELCCTLTCIQLFLVDKLLIYFVSCNFSAAMVAAFSGQNSMVNITSPKLSEVITSMAIQFKTTQSSSQIAAMMSGGKYFAINIESKKLMLKYNFNQTGNGTFDLGMNSLMFMSIQ